MASRYLNLTINQGTTFSQNVVAYSSASNTTPINLSGATFDGQLRTHYAATTNTLGLTLVGSGDANGQVQISLTNSETSGLKARRYVYDVEVTKSSTVTRIVEGIATVTPEATK